MFYPGQKKLSKQSAFPGYVNICNPTKCRISKKKTTQGKIPLLNYLRKTRVYLRKIIRGEFGFLAINSFLAARSSSRSISVGWLVGWLVAWS